MLDLITITEHLELAEWITTPELDSFLLTSCAALVQEVKAFYMLLADCAACEDDRHVAELVNAEIIKRGIHADTACYTK